MSNNVDNRIVRMTFDNEKFEKGVQTTLTTIEKLKNSLKLEKAGEAFENLNKAARDVDFKPLTDGIQQVHNNFSMLDSFVINFYNRIVNGAIDAGKKIVSALTIDPIKTGFQEYEEKINSIQVIAANTGSLDNMTDSISRSASEIERSFQAIETIWKGPNTIGNGQARFDALANMGLDVGYVQENINKLAYGQTGSLAALQKEMKATGAEGSDAIQHIEDVLDDLNLYADKTIYNFTQMTKSIGYFTTAGIDVDTSATAVKGIANLAAYVGAPAQDASRIMFQLSQALSAGSVRLQDWMSLEHSAGMGGKIFQDQLVATAEHYGIAAKEAIEAEGSFRQSLKLGWLTTDVLNETLAKFAGSYDDAYWAQLGYTQTEIDAIQTLGEVATDSATKVRTVSMMWDALREAAQSSWTETWQYIIGDYADAPKLLGWINENISELIGNLNAARNAGFKWWYEAKLGGRTTWFDQSTTIQKVKEYEEVIDEFGNVTYKWTGNYVAQLDKNGNVVKDKYGQIVYETERVTETTGILVNVYEALGNIISPISTALTDVFNTPFYKVLYNITNSVRQLSEWLLYTEWPLENIYHTCNLIFSTVKLGMHIVGGAIKIAAHLAMVLLPQIADVFFGLTGSVSQLFTTTGGIETIIGVVDNIVDTLTYHIDTLDFSLKGIFDTILDLIASVTGIDLRDVFYFITDKLSEVFAFISDFDLDNILGSLEPILDVLKNMLLVVPGLLMVIPSLISSLTGIDITEVPKWLFDSISNIIESVKNTDFGTVLNVLKTIGVVLLAIPAAIVGLPALLLSFLGFDIPGILQNIFDTVRNIIKEIKTGDINKYIKPFVDFYDKLMTNVNSADTLEGKIQAVIDTFRELFETLTPETLGDKLKKVTDSIKEFATGIFEKLFEPFKNFSFEDTFDKITTGITKFLKSFGIENFADLVKVGLILWFVIDACRTMFNVAHITDTFRDIGEGIVDTIEAITETFEAMQKSVLANAILKIAAAIGVLTLSILVLSLIPHDRLSVALVAIAGMMWGLVEILKVLGTALGGVAGGGTALGMGVMFAALAIMIGVITASIIKMGKTDEDILVKGVTVMYLIISIMKTMLRSLNGFAAGGLLGLAAVLISAGIAIGIIAKALLSIAKFASIGEQARDGLEAARTSILFVSAIVASLLFMLMKIPTTGAKLLEIGATLIAISVAIGILSACVMAIAAVVSTGLISPEAILIAELAILGVSYIAAGLVAILSIIKPQSVLKIVALLGALTVCIGVLTICITSLAMIESQFPGSIGIASTVIIKMGAVLAGLVLLTGVLSKFNTVKGSIGVLISIAAIVGAISSIAALVMALGSQDQESLNRGMEAMDHIAGIVAIMSTIIGAFIVLAAIVGKGSTGVKISVTLNAWALSFLGFGVGLLTAAAGVWLIVDALEKLFALFESLGDGSKSLAVLEGMIFFFDALVIAVLAAIPPLTNAILTAMVKILEQIAEYIGPITYLAFEIIWQVIVGAIMFLIKEIPTLVQLLCGLLEVLGNAIDPLVDAALTFVIKVLLATAKAIDEHGTEIVMGIIAIIAALIALIPKIDETFKEANGWSVGDWYINYFWKQAEEFGAKVYDFIANFWSTIVGTIVGIWNLFEAFGANVYDASVKFWGIVIGFFIYIWDYMKSIPTKIKAFFVGIWESIVGGIEEGMAKIKENPVIKACNNLVEGIKNAFTKKDAFDIHSPSVWGKNTGGSILDGIQIGAEEKQAGLFAFFDKLGKGIKSRITQTNDNLSDLTKAEATNVITDETVGLEEAADDTTDIAAEAGEETSQSFWDAYLANSEANQEEGLTDLASFMEQYKDQANIPDNTYGLFATSGSETGSVIDTMDALKKKAAYGAGAEAGGSWYSGFSSALFGDGSMNTDALFGGTQSFGFNSLFDAEGNITPIWDSSNSTSLFADGQVNMNYAGFSNPEDFQASIQGSIDQSENIAHIHEEIQNLRNDITKLGETFKRLNVYMDSGELVGAIADPMYDAIGTRVTRDNRS